MDRVYLQIGLEENFSNPLRSDSNNHPYYF